MVLGIWYLLKGLEQKDVLKLILASFAIIGALAIRHVEFAEYLVGNWFYRFIIWRNCPFLGIRYAQRLDG